MEIRRATEADLLAEQEVFRAAIGELYRRHSLEPPNPPPAAFEAQQGHLLRHDGERCFVAEDAGRIAPGLLLLAGDAVPPGALALSGYALF